MSGETNGTCAICVNFAPDWREKPTVDVPCAAEQIKEVPIFGRCSARTPTPLTESGAWCEKFIPLSAKLQERRTAKLVQIVSASRHREPGDKCYGRFEYGAGTRPAD